MSVDSSAPPVQNPPVRRPAATEGPPFEEGVRRFVAGYREFYGR